MGFGVALFVALKCEGAEISVFRSRGYRFFPRLSNGEKYEKI